MTIPLDANRRPYNGGPLQLVTYQTVTVSGTSAQSSAFAASTQIVGCVRIPKSDRIAVPSLTADGQKKPLVNGFVPHGPMLVKASFLWWARLTATATPDARHR